MALECLGNFDILSEVLQHTRDYTSQPGGHPIPQDGLVLAIALTCKGLSEPALDFVWRDIPNLLRLLKLLPAFTRVHGIYTSLGPLHATDFIRLTITPGKSFLSPGPANYMSPSMRLCSCALRSGIPNPSSLVCSDSIRQPRRLVQRLC
ncbi:hypothetical protein DFH09DRAFT_1121445 [Mycena vulgaris]|nr:hypothetical protein DFH09DRAFT_1121445 [Mycena vulgaris]